MTSDVTVILDRSGSMAPVLDDTIGGFNTFLRKQRDVPGACHLTLIQFADDRTMTYTGPIADMAPLTSKTYWPSGTTALLDAVGTAITEAGTRFAALPEAERPTRVLFVIITDGYENASHIYTRAQVREMIQHQQDKYAWHFMYLGADHDAIMVATDYGIPRAASLNFDKKSLYKTFNVASAYTTTMRAGMPIEAGFTQAERATVLTPDAEEDKQ